MAIEQLTLGEMGGEAVPLVPQTATPSERRERVPTNLGQGSLELGGIELPGTEAPREIDWAQPISISSLIKYISDTRNLDPSTITKRDMRKITPDYIACTLFLSEDAKDSDVVGARSHVVFPAAQFRLIASSPLRIERHAQTGVEAAREHMPDKYEVGNAAERAADHALAVKTRHADRLIDALTDERDFMATIIRELTGAGGTGWYAHYPAETLKVKLASAETALLDALQVSATRRGWNTEQYGRAQRTLEFQLFGKGVNRHANWVSYAQMAYRYARARRIVAISSLRGIEIERRSYRRASR